MKKWKSYLAGVLIFLIAWLIPSPLSGIGRGETQSKVQAVPMETAALQRAAPEDHAEPTAGAVIELPAEEALSAPAFPADHAAPETGLRAAPADGADEEAPAEETAELSEEEPTETLYILNKNSHKFHYPDCSSVDDMADKNKEEFYGDREELIEMGYSPCGRCKP